MDAARGSPRLQGWIAGASQVMRNRIVGLIGVFWGGAIVVTRLLAGGAAGGESGAYAAGQTGGLVLGVLLFGVGVYCLFKRVKA